MVVFGLLENSASDRKRSECCGQCVGPVFFGGDALCNTVFEVLVRAVCYDNNAQSVQKYTRGSVLDLNCERVF